MSRWKIINLVLIIGLGIGVLVPIATSWWYDRDRIGGITLNALAESTATNQDAPNVTYHFRLQQGVLSVVEGKPGVNGKVIVTGLSVESWPKEMLEIAPKVEFYSFDEVQSFIDTVNEPLWRE